MGPVIDTYKSMYAYQAFKRLSNAVNKNTFWVKIYGGFLSVIFILYLFFSDGDFSFLLTLSSLVGTLSFLMVSYCVYSSRSASGISLNMFVSYAFIFLFRLFSIIPYQGYLPYDRSGDWLYQSSEVACFLLSAYICYLCYFSYRDSYEDSDDTLKAYYILAPSFLLACILHSSLNNNLFSDISWAFAMYAEALCVLPQLIMFQNGNGKVIPFQAHFLAAQALSRVLSFCFWISTYKELNTSGNILKPFVGWWVVLMQFLQIAIMGDFIYCYVRCLKKGVPVEFMLSDNV